MKPLVAILLLTACAGQPVPSGPITPQAEAFERGYWAGWRQHAIAVGGGL